MVNNMEVTEIIRLLSTVSINKKRHGDKIYVQGISQVPLNHKSKILWLKANSEVLRAFIENPWSRTPIFLAIALPTSVKKERNQLIGPEEILEELKLRLNAIKNKDFELSDTIENDILEDQDIKSMAITKAIAKKELVCPICSHKSQYTIYDRLSKVKPNLCPNCHATVLYDFYDDIIDTAYNMLNANDSKECIIEKQGDHYKGNEVITITRKISKRKAVAIQIEPHSEDYTKPEIYMLFVERNPKKELIERIKQVLPRESTFNIEENKIEIKIDLSKNT